MSDEIITDFPVTPADEDDTVTMTNEEIRLVKLEAQNEILLQMVGQIAGQVNWIGSTLNGLLTTAANMGGPGGKLMSMMLGGGKNNG
jgi:hypothetical protein